MKDGAYILLIDDEQAIADVVVYALAEHGFRVGTAFNGDDGLRLFRKTHPDLVLLDLNMPGLSGWDLFYALKAHNSATPVIMLTSRGDEFDRVMGLEIGADDYVTKPFSPRELVARVKALLRRVRGPGGDAPLRQGPFVLNESAYTVQYHGQPLRLTRPEFKLLALLLRHPARVFERDTLVRRLYDDEHPVTDRSIDTHIKRLRRKCAEIHPDSDPIEAVYGVGYKLRHGIEDVS